MYEKLQIEMARQNLNYRQLITRAGMTYTTVLPKLRGKSYTGALTLIEASKIRKALGVKISLEELFAEDIETAEKIS